MLEEAGVRMGLVSLPASAPVRPYRDFVIGSWMKDRKSEKKGSRAMFFPKSVEKIIRRHPGCVLRELGADKYAAFVYKPEGALEKSEELARLRLNNFLKLNEKFNLDLGFIYFDFPDRIAHLVREGHAVIKQTVKLCDALLGEAMDAAKPERILVFSDHGWGFHRSATLHHDPWGFYASTGREGAERDARIVDVPPTILKEFNVEAPPYFEGRSL